MAVPFSNTKLRVPRGFQNLLEGLAREVLRAQPEDVHAFAAQYFEDLLKIRDGGGDDPSKIGADLEDRFYNNKSFQDPDVDPSNPDHQKAALSIQTKYRQYHAKKEVEKMKEEQAAVTIQAGIRGYHARKEVEEIKKDEPQNETGAPEEDIDIDLNDPEVNAAATKIQASFKGHKARKEVQAIKECQNGRLDAISEGDSRVSAEKQQQAATKIQAHYRGFHARKQLDDNHLVSHNNLKNTSQNHTSQNHTNQKREVSAATTIQAHIRGYLVRKDIGDREKAATRIQAQVKGRQTRAKHKKQKAATKIQAIFRGYFTRKKLKMANNQEEEVDIDLNDPDVQDAAAKIQAKFRGKKFGFGKKNHAKVEEKKKKEAEVAKTEEAKKPEEEEIDIDLNDPEVANAATKIQANFRGYKTRKGMKDGETKDDEAPAEPAKEEKKKEEEEIDIDLDDPETAKAALKIQSTFRGHMARKEVKKEDA